MMFVIVDAPRGSSFADDSLRDRGHWVRTEDNGEEGDAYEIVCACGWEGNRAGWATHKRSVSIWQATVDVARGETA